MVTADVSSFGFLHVLNCVSGQVRPHPSTRLISFASTCARARTCVCPGLLETGPVANQLSLLENPWICLLASVRTCVSTCVGTTLPLINSSLMRARQRVRNLHLDTINQRSRSMTLQAGTRSLQLCFPFFLSLCLHAFCSLTTNVFFAPTWCFCCLHHH